MEKDLWRALEGSGRLGDVATVRNGIIVGLPQRKSHLSERQRGPDWKPWLSGASDLVPYAVHPKEQLFLRWPGNLERPRPNLFREFATGRAKVLVNAGRNPGSPWRIYAAVDEVGYYPSQALHCVVPKGQSTTVEEIAAVLNSPVASAWVDSRNRRRWIAARTLLAMPFPDFSDAMRGSIVGLVQDVMGLLRQEVIDVDEEEARLEKLHALVTSIDQLVFESFEIGQEGRSALDNLFAGYRRPGTKRGSSLSSADSADITDAVSGWPVTGQVINVSAKDDSIVMWLRGLHDSQPFSTSIPDEMPGWALRPDTAFQAESPKHMVEPEEFRPTELRSFSPIDFASSTNLELVDLLQHPSKLNDLYEG